MIKRFKLGGLVMFWIKLFWVEVALFPTLMIYLILASGLETIFQKTAMLVYVSVLATSIGGYIYKKIK